MRFLRGRATPRPGSHGARARACLYMKSGSRMRVTHRGEQKGMRVIVARGVMARRHGQAMGISSQIAPSRVWQRTRSSRSYANVIVKAPREDAHNANHTFQRRARLDCWPCSVRRAILKPEAKALSGASQATVGLEIAHPDCRWVHRCPQFVSTHCFGGAVACGSTGKRGPSEGWNIPDTARGYMGKHEEYRHRASIRGRLLHCVTSHKEIQVREKYTRNAQTRVCLWKYREGERREGS